MFLAAAPYFQKRFSSDPWILENSQSAILSVSTLMNLAAMLVLTNVQSSASYPFRINLGLGLNVLIFALLTLTTKNFLDISAQAYFGFLLVLVGSSSWATGLIQNGAFAFAAGFGRPEYMQAVMAGQGVAGVLPPLAQMASVLIAPTHSPVAQPADSTTTRIAREPTSPGPSLEEAGTAAFIYFLTAVAVSLATLIAFVPLTRRHRRRQATQRAEASTEGDAAASTRRFVGIPTLIRKLHWPAFSVFICFAVAMFFPVFTSKILSVRSGGSGGSGDDTNVPRLFQAEVFIPLGFFVWNLGDLAGRVSTILPFSLRHRPAVLSLIGVARALFLPLYLLCNIRGRGAVVPSDAFYLFAVQFPFGLTNGWLGSSSMMAAGEWVEDDEREAAGSFMGLALVAGLTVGSLSSFSAAGI